jgi:hypothetical protein
MLWLWLIGLMLTSVTLVSAMICFQSFFALFIRAFARELLSINEYSIFVSFLNNKNVKQGAFNNFSIVD